MNKHTIRMMAPDQATHYIARTVDSDRMELRYLRSVDSEWQYLDPLEGEWVALEDDYQGKIKSL